MTSLIANQILNDDSIIGISKKLINGCTGSMINTGF